MHCISTKNTWTVCIHFSSTDSVAKLLSRVDNSLIMCRGHFISTTITEEWRECPALRKRDLRKKYEKHLLSSFQKTKLTQNSGSVYANRIEQVKMNKFGLELMKIVDCFPVSLGNYSTNLVSFKMKFMLTNRFLNCRDMCKSIDSANDIVMTPIKKPIAIKNETTKKFPNVRQKHATHS